MQLLPADKSKRRKLLVYAGIAGALLLVVLISRRDPAEPAIPPEEPITPVGSPAPTDPGVGSGGNVDNGAQLASFENALLDQLPAAVESGVAAGLANGVSAPAAGAAGTTVINIGSPSAKPGAPKTRPIPHPAAKPPARRTPKKHPKGKPYKWPNGTWHTRPYRGH